MANVEKQQIPALLAEADVVSLQAPITKETENLIDGVAPQLMKRNGIRINAARGGVMDEAAVIQAFIAGKLGGAAFDVFAKEPLGRGPEACRKGAKLDPHAAYSRRDGRVERERVVGNRNECENVRKALNA